MIEIRNMKRVPPQPWFAHAKIEPALSNMQAFYAEVEQLAGIGCWYFSVADQTLWWSDELYRLHELEPDTPLSSETYVTTCVYPEDRLFVTELFSSLAAGKLDEIQGQARIVSQTGNVHQVHFRAHRQAETDRADIHYVGIVLDRAIEKEMGLSTIQRVERRDANSEHSPSSEPTLSLKLLVEAAPEPVVITDGQGCIVTINSRVHTAFGYTPQELIGQPIGLILEATGPDEGSHADHSSGPFPHRQAMQGRHKNGLTFPIEIHTSRFETDDGILSIHFVVDVSKYRHAEQELRNALQQERELSEMKSRFVSIVSHEFRTPLAVIQATSETLRDFINQMDEDQWTRKFNKISGQVSHMTDMLEDILVFGKMASANIELKREWVSLSELLEDAVTAAQERYARHTFITTSNDTCDGCLDSVHLDRKLINQTFSNLLSNAAKYSAVGTRIWLHVAYDEQFVAVTVRDEGIGIPGEDHAHLFEPFHRGANTSGKQGTGLGLSIARQAVELHGGSMTFESEVGVGTTFTVTLPTGRTLQQSQNLDARSSRDGAA